MAAVDGMFVDYCCCAAGLHPSMAGLVRGIERPEGEFSAGKLDLDTHPGVVLRPCSGCRRRPDQAIHRGVEPSSRGAKMAPLERTGNQHQA